MAKKKIKKFFDIKEKNKEVSNNKFTIIRDTREQTPWSFRSTAYCNGHIDDKVEHGDYSIVGLEHLIFIERKASPGEIAGNILEKRFDKLLLASEAYKYRYMICEFSLDKLLSYPYGNGLPAKAVKRIRLRGNFILSKLQSYEIKHGIHIVFCGNSSDAQKYTLALLKKINSIEN